MNFIKCGYCKKDKKRFLYSPASLSNYAQGKKVFCEDCKSEFIEEIAIIQRREQNERSRLKYAKKQGFNSIQEYQQHLINKSIPPDFLKCRKCKEEKPFNEFRKDSTKKWGIDRTCLICEREESRKRRLKNPDYDKNYRLRNIEKIKEFENSNERKEYKKEYFKKYYDKNKDKFINYREDLKKNNPEKMKAKRLKDKLKRNGCETVEQYEELVKNKAMIKEAEKREKKEFIIAERERKKKQFEAEKEQRKEERRIRTNERRKIDHQFRIMDNLRARTRKVMRIQSAKKTTAMAKLIGLSGKKLVEYMLSIGWDSDTDHIDHIVPISFFDMAKKEHQMIACYYKNLQPLSRFDNGSKGDKAPIDWIERIVSMCNERGIDYIDIVEHIDKYMKDNNKKVLRTPLPVTRAVTSARSSYHVRM